MSKFLPRNYAIALVLLLGEIFSYILHFRFGYLSILFTILHVLFGVVLVLQLPKLFSDNATEIKLFGKNNAASKTLKFVLVAIALLVFAYCFNQSWQQFLRLPISYQGSDVLITIKEMINTFTIKGSHAVYTQPIAAPYGEIYPNYYPMTWFPYYLIHFVTDELRLVNCLAYGIIFTLFIVQIIKSKLTINNLLLFCGSLFFLVWLSISQFGQVIGVLTYEPLIALYYIFLFYAFYTRKTGLIFAAFALCLLSRYMAAGVALTYFIDLLWNKKYKTSAIAIGLSITAVALFINFFGYDVLLKLLSAHTDYISFAQSKWTVDPKLITNGLGFTKFFGKNATVLQHNFLTIGILSLPLILWWLQRRTNYFKNQTLFWLACIKLSLIYFLAFIDISFVHLYLSSLLFSFALLIFVPQALAKK